MSEGRRRPPEGKSFPFLRRGEGQKTKIAYPVLKKAGRQGSEASRESIHSRPHTSEDVQDNASPTGDDDYSDRPRLGTASSETEWRTPSVPRTVRTADSGFDQEGENAVNEELDSPPSSSSTGHEDSPTSSSVAQTNIDLRKGTALPLQKWVRKNEALSSPPVVSSSPMLASTPQDAERDSVRPFHPVPALETSILGNMTNVDSKESHVNEKKSEGSRAEQQSRRPVGISSRGIHMDKTKTGTRPSNAQLNGVPPVTTAHSERACNSRMYTEVERKLVEQLRNAIAHLDLADMEQRMKSRELDMAYAKFREDVRAFEVEKEAEKERVQRVRRQLERERKIANKDGTERDKAVEEQIEDLTKTIAQKDRQISTLRLRLRKSEDQAELKDRELTESNKKVERLEKSFKTLQRQLAQLRGNYAKQSQEMAAQLQAAQTRNPRRRGTIGLLPTLYSEKKDQEPAVPEPTRDNHEHRNPVQEKSKCVSWADNTAPATILGEGATPMKGSYVMELVETADAGRLRLFRNGIGDWTKVTNTECHCDFYEYSNSDICWLSCDRTVEINYFGIAGATVITLNNGCSIRYFNSGQIELYRLSGEISRFDSVTKQRTETMIAPNRTRYVEIFDSSGCCLRLEGSSKTCQRFGERSTYRGYPSDRHVYNHSNIEPEWIEPEYNARRCPDGSLKIKFPNIMVCCLGLEDVGYVKHITRLENGSERKLKCVEWGRVARANQRQIEARKCQNLTALNATM